VFTLFSQQYYNPSPSPNPSSNPNPITNSNANANYNPPWRSPQKAVFLDRFYHLAHILELC